MNLLMNNMALAVNNLFKFFAQDHIFWGLLELSDKKLTLLKVTYKSQDKTSHYLQGKICMTPATPADTFSKFVSNTYLF